MDERKDGLGYSERRGGKEGCGGREGETENVRCLDLPAVRGAKRSWPWCKASYEGKLHVAFLGFHTARTLSYSTKWTQ